MRTPAVLFLALSASLAFGCSSTTTSISDGGAAALDDAALPAVDPPGPDAASGDTASRPDTGVDAGSDAPTGACVVKRAMASSACAEDCGARLTLPGGGVYCTTECAITADCAEYGGDLVCPETIGACVPRCTGNASCTTGGFLRCDTQTGGCDTL